MQEVEPCVSVSLSVCAYEDSGLMPCDLYASQGHMPFVAMLAVAPPMQKR